MAAVLHIAVGSVTLSAITAAGIIAPVAATMGLDPLLIALAAGSGALFCIHVTSNTFWLLQTFLDQSVRGALKTVTDLRAPRTDWPRKLCSSQKVFEVTWMQNSAPEPAASAISSGSSPRVAATGATTPAAVIAERVTEPTAMCSTAAISQTSSSGAAAFAEK